MYATMTDNKCSSLIYDEAEIIKFFNDVIVPLEDDEVYIMLLNARKKYCPNELSRSEEVLKREIIRNDDMNDTLRKIRRMSFVDGVYVDRNTLKDISAGCMVLYMVIDPRSTLDGYYRFMTDMNKWIYQTFRDRYREKENEDNSMRLYRKIDIKLFSAIHKSRSRRLYIIVDIDKKDEETLIKVVELLDGHIRWISETHGGFHVIVNRNYESSKIVYENIRKMEDVEILKDPVTPIPGVLQGGFVVTGIMKDIWES